MDFAQFLLEKFKDDEKNKSQIEKLLNEVNSDNLSFQSKMVVNYIKIRLGLPIDRHYFQLNE